MNGLALLEEREDRNNSYHGPYYADSAVRTVLKRSKIRYVTALNKQRFTTLLDGLDAKVEKSGDWETQYEVSSNEIITCAWSINKNIGKKFVLTNAYTGSISKGLLNSWL